MKKSLLVIAAAASAFAALAFPLPEAAASPAPATAFPGLTTIYVASGVFDSGDSTDLGTATSIHCSNVSGVLVQLRVLILGPGGSPEASLSFPISHGLTATLSTHLTAVYFDTSLATGALSQGVLNVEATNSGVFCTAMTINASLNTVEGVPLHLVRVNPHPGTVE